MENLTKSDARLLAQIEQAAATRKEKHEEKTITFWLCFYMVFIAGCAIFFTLNK